MQAQPGQNTRAAATPGPAARPSSTPRPRTPLPLRPATPAGFARPAAALPGTVPFADAAQAWFWTVASLAARRDGSGGGEGRIRIPRPCDPDDVIRALDLLYRRGGITPAHARVLRRWGDRLIPPQGDGAAVQQDTALWNQAMERLEGLLRAKGIVA